MPLNLAWLGIAHDLVRRIFGTTPESPSIDVACLRAMCLSPHLQTSIASKHYLGQRWGDISAIQWPSPSFKDMEKPAKGSGYYHFKQLSLFTALLMPANDFWMLDTNCLLYWQKTNKAEHADFSIHLVLTSIPWFPVPPPLYGESKLIEVNVLQSTGSCLSCKAFNKEWYQ